MNDKPRVLGNRYEVGELLGRGGMAEVHIGRDTRLGRVVAIKLLRVDLARDATFQARFRREAQSAAALNHPAIVAVYDTGEEQVADAVGGVVALPYIVMEYVEGRTLRELMHDGRPLDVDTALEVTARVLSALDYSHRAGIVHRDIKPANVMMSANGDVKVMDFGIARAIADATSAMTQTQAVIGTAQYLSPEQARGETVDARSDLYSAGCLLYELLTGRPPFVADSPVAVAYQHVREEPQPPSVHNPAVPETVDRIVLHALAKDRETRYQTAADFRADLQAALTGRPVSAVAAAAQGAATTQFLGAPATGTRTIQQPLAEPVAYGAMAAGTAVPPQGLGGGMLPGAPVDDDLGPRRDRRREPSGGGGRAGTIVAVVLALALVGGLVAFTLSKLNSGNNTASTQATTVQVPYVIGKKLADAQAGLTAKGFGTAPLKQENSDKPKGVVIDQDPRTGEFDPTKQQVTLTVSSGAATVTVPRLEGLSQDDAVAELTKAGLGLGGTTTVDDKDHKANEVVKSSPAEGEKVDKGSSVKLTLASGFVQLDDLTNKSYNEAVGILANLGLRYPNTPQMADDPEGREANTVIKQSQIGRVKVGSKVVLTVSKGAANTPSPSPSVTPPGESPSPTPTLTP